MKPIAHWKQAPTDPAFEAAFWDSFWTGAFSRPRRIAKAVTQRLLKERTRPQANPLKQQVSL